MNRDINIIGYVSPQAIESEEIILSTLIQNFGNQRDFILKVLTSLVSESFYKESHRFIFDLIQDEYKNGRSWDLISVIDKAKKEGVLDSIGGVMALTQMDKVSLQPDIHFNIVIEKWMYREIIRVCSIVVQDSYHESEDPMVLLRMLSNLADNIYSNNNDSVPLYISVANTLKQISAQISTPGGSIYTLFGIPEMDYMINGGERGDLIVMAGRPGMGKSIEAVHIANYVGIEKARPCLYLSLEMTREALIRRLLAHRTGIDSNKIKRGELTEEEWESVKKASVEISNSKIIIEDDPVMDMMKYRQNVYKHLKEGIEVVIIDHGVLMSLDPGPESTTVKIGNLTKQLKQISKKENLITILLWQLSRSVESRSGDKRPILSDLRESGNIEENADKIIFLYRPEYYGYELIEVNKVAISSKGVIQNITAKHRDGKIGIVSMSIKLETSSLHDINEKY